MAGLCHASDLRGGQRLDSAYGLEELPPGDLCPEAAGRDPRAGERRVLGPPPVRFCCLRDQPADLL